MRWVAAIAAMAMLAACGETESDALSQTEQRMAELKAATIDLRYAATAGAGDSQTDPVGFQLAGPFEFSDKHDLAVFDLTYTRLLGGDEEVTAVRSTGESAFATVEDTTYKIDDRDLDSLRISDDTDGGLGDLGIADWVRNPKTAPGDKIDGELTDVITGDVDVAAMLSDLARISESVGGDTELGDLDDDAASRLQKLVKASEIKIVTTSKNYDLKSLRAVVDFGTTAPAQLRKSLGAYADARLAITLTLKKATKQLRVEAPANYEEA
ncbi:MAG: hypothetical protein Q8K63_12400 [Acidimicrobiales bacterium]|nr:hypothetical protein [Acidimicrobiales bacterium]